MDETFVGLDQRADGLLVVRLRGPGKVTTLSSGMLDALEELASKLERLPAARAAVLLGDKPSGFMAGADLKELLAAWEAAPDAAAKGRLAEEAVGRCQAIFNRFEGLPYPTVAAIHGACLGGGFELALACDARVAADDPKTSVGLPEVNLGLIPAAGGTQRLTRLVGMSNAMELILEGKRLDAKRALRRGLVDRLAPRRALERSALELAEQLAAGKAKLKRQKRVALPMRVMEAVGWGRDVIENKAIEAVQAKTKGHYPAPVKAAELIAFAADGNSLEEGLRRERQAFGELASGDVARHLIGVFFLMERGKNASPVECEPGPMDRVGVVGAGFMGSGVAQLAASKGHRVYLKDRDEKSLGRGMKTCGDLFIKLEKSGRLGAGGARVAMGKLRPCLEYRDLREADLVVEAVFEEASLKREVLAAVEAAVPAHCVIATNTSGIPLAEISPALKRPENFVGMHFFSPVHKMPLLEIVRGKATSEVALQTAVRAGQAWGKTVIVVADGQGFFTTRVLGLYLVEAFRQMLEGAEVGTIDKALERFGWPVGPFKLMDEVGIDVGVHVSTGLRGAFPDRVPEVGPLQGLVQAGRLGRKAGKGFYQYGKGKGEVDRSVYRDLPGRKSTSSRDAIAITDQIMAVLVNEAVLCLQEGILSSPEDGDTGMIMGLGFPPFRGGLFRWVDEVGAERFVKTLADLAGEGVGTGACELLQRNAREGRRFYDAAGQGKGG
jgi:3-hydroxyacyl-CoA dehydrogenase/enoyl-CoA hydratase/3-hydroxybutyryl-CoA epimerase